MSCSFICENCNEVNFHFSDVVKYETVYCKECDEKNLVYENIEYVYILDSEHSKNILKIGFTARNPEERMQEINLGTGSIPWKVAIFYRTFTGRKLEHKIFNELSDYRIEKKELFKTSVEDTIKIISNSFLLNPDFVRSEFEYLIDEYSDSDIKMREIVEFGSWKGICPKCNHFLDIFVNHLHETPCPYCGNFIQINNTKSK